MKIKTAKTKILLNIIIIIIYSSLSRAEDFYDYVKKLEKNLASADIESQLMLIDNYTDEYFLDKDYRLDGVRSKVDKSFVKNALENNENPFSIYAKGFALQNGLFGYSKNEAEGKKLIDSIIKSLKDMGDNGNSNACLILSYIYAGEQSSEKKNFQEAFNWAAKSHKLGNPIATVTMSSLLIRNNNLNDINSGLNLIANQSIPKNIKEKELLRALVNSWNIQDFDFDIENTGFSRSTNFGVCTLKNNKLNVFMKLEFDIKSLSPFELGPLQKITIQSAFNSRVTYQYDIFKKVTNMDQTKSWLAPAKHGLLLMSLPKAVEWRTKALELQPESFDKIINVQNGDNFIDHEEQPYFYWDGLLHATINGTSINNLVFLNAIYSRIIEDNENSLTNKCRDKLASMHEESLRQNSLQDQFN